MKSVSDLSKTLMKTIIRVVWILGLNAFLLVLILVIVNFIFGGFVFYKYVFLAEKEAPKITENILKFNYKTYYGVLEELRIKEQQNSEEPF